MTSDDAEIDDGTAGPNPTLLMESYSDLITSKKRLEEGFEMRTMLKSMPTAIEKGSEWFFLPKKWLDVWETYCYVDIINAELDPVELRRANRTAPGRISFKHLFEPEEENQIKDISSKTQWQNFQVKKGLREGVDFIFVTKTVFKAFLNKYNSVDEEPAMNFLRVGVEQDDGEVVLEMQMRKINFLALPNKTRFKMKEPWFVYVPKSLNIFELEKKLQQASNNYLREEQQDFSYKVKDCRLWVTDMIKWADLENIDQKYRSVTTMRTKMTPVSITESQKKKKVDDLNFIDDDVFILETKKEGSWVFKQ